jgi:DNA-binding NtrC family response regulator
MSALAVLFVDDDPLLLRGVWRLMRDQPYPMMTASSAAEAIQVIKSHPIGVVVSDERMPGCSGSEFLTWVAKHCPEVVRIMMTGHASPDVAMRAVNDARVFRFFPKPFRVLDMAMAVRDGLDMHAAAAGIDFPVWPSRQTPQSDWRSE